MKYFSNFGKSKYVWDMLKMASKGCAYNLKTSMYWMCYLFMHSISVAMHGESLIWFERGSVDLLEGRDEADVWIQSAELGGVFKSCFGQLEFMKRKQELHYPLYFISAKSEVLMPNKTVCLNAVSLKSDLEWKNTNKCLMMLEVKNCF